MSLVHIISVLLENTVAAWSLLTEDEVTDALVAKFKPQLPAILKALNLDPNSLEAATLVIDRVKVLDPTRNKINVGWILKQLRQKNIRIAILPDDPPEDEDRIIDALTVLENAKSVPNFMYQADLNAPNSADVFSDLIKKSNSKYTEILKEALTFILQHFAHLEWYDPQLKKEYRYAVLHLLKEKHHIHKQDAPPDLFQLIDSMFANILSTYTPLEKDIYKYESLNNLEDLVYIIRQRDFKSNRAKVRSKIEKDVAQGAREFCESENYFLVQVFKPETAPHYFKFGAGGVASSLCVGNAQTAAGYMSGHGGSLFCIYKKVKDEFLKYGCATANLDEIKDFQNKDLHIDSELNSVLTKVAELLVDKAQTASEIFGLINADILSKFNVDPNKIEKLMDVAINDIEKSKPGDILPFRKVFKLTENQAKRLYKAVASKQTGMKHGQSSYQLPVGSPEALDLVAGALIASLSKPDEIYAWIHEMAGNRPISSILVGNIAEALLLNENTPNEIIANLYETQLHHKMQYTFRAALPIDIAYKAVLHPSTPESDKTAMLVKIWQVGATNYRAQDHTLQHIIDMLCGADSAKYLPPEMKYEFLSGVSSQRVLELFRTLEDKNKGFEKIIRSSNFTRTHALPLTVLPEINNLTAKELQQWLDFANKESVDTSGIQVLISRRVLNDRLVTRGPMSADVLKQLDPDVANLLAHLLNKKT